MNDQADFIIADLKNFVRGEIVALGLNVNANLRDSPPLGTPIDTGWASANWVPSVDAPFIENSEPPDDISASQVAARSATAQQGVNSILGWNFNNGSIFSTNNVPYIGPLNAGSSPQTPAGFIQTAVERAVTQTAAGASSRSARSARQAAFKSRRGK